MLDLTAFYHNFLKTHYSIKTFNYYSTKLIPVRHKKKVCHRRTGSKTPYGNISSNSVVECKISFNMTVIKREINDITFAQVFGEGNLILLSKRIAPFYHHSTEDNHIVSCHYRVHFWNCAKMFFFLSLIRSMPSTGFNFAKLCQVFIVKPLVNIELLFCV